LALTLTVWAIRIETIITICAFIWTGTMTTTMPLTLVMSYDHITVVFFVTGGIFYFPVTYGLKYLIKL